MCDNKKVNFVVRKIQMSDCDEVREMWTMHNFKAPKYDNEVIMKAYSEGIFVAQDVNTGKLLGACIGVNLSPDLAFIGRYCVRTEYRKMGIGREIWRIVMEHIGTERNVRLFGGGNMAEMYRDKCNFTIVPEGEGLIFIGKVDCNKLIQENNGISIIPINKDIIEKVIEYDKEVCDGLDRTVLIEETVKIKEFVNAVAVNEKNEVLGYCILKVSNFDTGVVEPLYANDEKIAELLLAKCCQSMTITQTKGVIFKCWKSNTHSISIAKRLGLQLTWESNALFTKKLIDGNRDQIFCMSSRCFYPF